MKPLPDNEIESELSYAYVHAVAAHAGMECESSGRHSDNHGVDAKLNAWLPDAAPGELCEVPISLQLKATVATPVDKGSHWSYFLRGIDRYDALRDERVTASPRILVVLFLPQDKTQWLDHSEERLSLMKCAWWVSLKGAPPVSTGSGTTVYLPKSNPFNPEGLTALAREISRGNIPRYAVPAR